MASLCKLHGICRSCGYRWWQRFVEGGSQALKDRKRTPHTALRLRERWEQRMSKAIIQKRDFGPKKLRWKLRCDYPGVRVPCVRTLSRWLHARGKVRRQTRRARSGPVLRLRGRLAGRCANDVWTLDFKGQFRTGDGSQINAFTVRDLASRYVLCVQHLPKLNERCVGTVMRRLFKRYGLPRTLRMDNGIPFSSDGPRGWSKLSVSWVKLGIRIEYGRPRCPQDNAEHEQMHGVLKKFTVAPPAANPAAQQRRFDRWRYSYNYCRPHESLRMRTPAQRYAQSPRTLPAIAPSWTYPKAWVRIDLDAKGRYFWQGRQRLIGKAFIREQLGARKVHHRLLAVYLGSHLLGHLHLDDPAGLRPVLWRQPLTPVPKGAAPLSDSPRSL